MGISLSKLFVRFLILSRTTVTSPCLKFPAARFGPVGKLLKRLNRHPYRPSHMHFMTMAVGFDTLVSAVDVRGDPSETSDALFGVKFSLIVDVETVTSDDVAKQCGNSVGDWLIEWDFVLPLPRTFSMFGHVG